MNTDPLSIIQNAIVGDGNVIGDHNIVQVIKRLQVEFNLSLSRDDLRELLLLSPDIGVPSGRAQSSACIWVFPSESDSSRSVNAFLSKGCLDGELYYLADEKGTLYCLDIGTGKQPPSWTTPNLPSGVKGGLALADLGRERALVVPCLDGKLHVVDLVTGITIDTYKLSGSPQSTPVAKYGEAYVGCTVKEKWGGIVGLRLRDGALLGKWSAPNNKGVKGSPIVLGSQVWFATLDWNGDTVFRTSSRRNDKAELIFRTQGMISTSPVLDKIRHLIYLTCEDGFVYAIDFCGNLVWRIELKAPTRCTGVVSGDRFYVGDQAGNFYALALDVGGSCVWVAEEMAEGAITAKAAIHNRAVIFGARDGRVYAVSCENGELLGSFEVGGKITRSLSVSEQGTVLVGGSTGKLFGLRWHLGERKKMAQHLESLGDLEEAAVLWMETGELSSAIRCYSKSGRHRIAAIVAEHNGLYRQAALNYESAARLADEPRMGFELFYQASRNWQELEEFSDAHRCLSEGARVVEAPFLVLTPENRLYRVRMGVDIFLEFQIENQGFSRAEQIIVQIVGDLQRVCRREVTKTLLRGAKESFRIEGILPTTRGKKGGVAVLTVCASYRDQHGKSYESIPIQIDILVS